MIVCLLLPYFAAKVESRELSLLADTPIILWSGEKKVAAYCDRAAARGVMLGMTVRKAKWLCPDAQISPINYQTIRQRMGDIVQVLSQFTHRIELERLPAKIKPRTNPFPDPRQSAVYYVDLERLNVLDATHLAQEMGRAVRDRTGFSSACGLTAGKFSAYAAATRARAGHLRVVAPGEEAIFLAPLSITLLPMPDETKRRLLLLPIKTIGAFAALAVDDAAAQTGKNGVLFHQLAHGLDSRRVVPTALQVVERVTRDLELPVSDRNILGAFLRSMATELSARLQASGCVGKTLVLQLSFAHQEPIQHKTTLRQPDSSPRYLSNALLRLLARVEATTGICGLVVTLADLLPFAGQQLELFPEQPKPRERLHKGLSSLIIQPGAPACYWILRQDPVAGRLEQRYAYERVLPL